MNKFIVATYNGEMMITADTCELIDGNLVFVMDGAVMGVWQEWDFVCRYEEPKLKVVK